MKKPAFYKLAAIMLLSLCHHHSFTQNNTYQNGNGWSFSLGTGASFAVKSNEGTLFRGNSMASKMTGQYNFGHIGLGINSGIVPGSISSSAVNSFLTERKFPADAIISSTKPQNAFLLLGPTFNFGKQVTIHAQLAGGVFYNNAGALAINQQGATRALYRFDAGSKNIFPGAGGSVQFAYPFSNSTRFFINTDYLQTQSSIRVFDPQRGIDIPSEQNRDVKLFTAGVGIIKSFGTARETGSGMATGKKHIGNVKYEAISTTRETGSGMATGKRILQPREPASGIATGKRNMAAGTGNTENCGPVSFKTTSPDGTVEEKTFSCPADAANYAKQTQGTSFGEKVNQGLHAAGSALAQGASRKNIIHRDIAARNIIAGIVTWGNGNSNGIVTNRSAGSGAAAASYAATGRSMNMPSGISTTIHAREAGSGMATGRRQYQPVFFEGGENDCSSCAVKVHNNPLYQDAGNNGTNPLHKNERGTTGSCNGVAGLKVYLTDIASGAIVASTTTEDCGEFYFANVPDGSYTVKISGSISTEKKYDVTINSKGNYDVAGEMLLADDYFSIEIITATGTPEEAAAVVKTKTKSNQSNDRIINTSRSNIKNMALSLADTDGDGQPEIWAGNAILGGALPGGNVISAAMRPGNPIGGLNIKGGKNPGSNARTTSTNEYGEFEFTGWDEGSYSITAPMRYIIADETTIDVGDADAANIVTSESNLKGDVKATAAQNSQSLKINNINNGMPNRISMNVTVPKQTQGATFGEKVNAGMNTPGMRAQNNNTVRSNRTDNAIIMADLDGDGEMESSVLSFTGEVATITLTQNDAAGKVVEKATSGLKDVVKTQVRMAGSPAPWAAADAPVTRVHGDPHVNEKDGTLFFDGSNTAVAKGKWRGAPVAIKAMQCSDGTCAIITAGANDYPAVAAISLNGLPPGEPVANAAVWFTDNKGNTYTGTTDERGSISLNGLPPGVPVRMLMNMRCNGTDDFIISFSTDAAGNAISNVLKTKHDTAKNAIGNIR